MTRLSLPHSQLHSYTMHNAKNIFSFCVHKILFFLHQFYSCSPVVYKLYYLLFYHTLLIKIQKLPACQVGFQSSNAYIVYMPLRPILKHLSTDFQSQLQILYCFSSLQRQHTGSLTFFTFITLKSSYNLSKLSVLSYHISSPHFRNTLKSTITHDTYTQPNPERAPV